MYGQISTVAFVGIEARPVEVQVRISGGAHVFAIVGLPDKAVAESRERVRNALHAVGLGLPYKHITVKARSLLGFTRLKRRHCAPIVRGA
jgi:magnesium chelatase family protein